MTQVVSETELTSTQRLRGLPDFTSRHKVSAKVLSIKMGDNAQYKVSTIVKLTHELSSLLILLQEVGQEGDKRLEKANENASQNGK
eukprot:snap_masked-scaffold_7-processed-gene-15.7-mRNA-1 protein AED:1.00 eAED:1.00 QI:0/-1/0/0/-1/1/1/0/85